MKRTIALLIFCLLSSVAPSLGDVKLPKGTFTADRLEEALKTAVDQKKPVAYLYTNTATTCPLASGASEGFLDAVGRRCVLVYLPVKGSKFQVDAAVKTALNKGKFYPKLVLTAADGTQAQCFTYEAYRDDSKKTAREIKRQIAALSKKQP